jgi:predicted HicB family RNase H-like nuclease
VKKLIYTKRAMSEKFLFRATRRDAELLTAAALRQEISRGDFIRQSIREKAARVLASEEPVQAEAHRERETVG